MDWCKGGGKHDEGASASGVISEHRPRARKIRCPICNKYLKQQIRECDDDGCWHIKVPPHKAKK